MDKRCHIRQQAHKQRRRILPLRFITGNKHKVAETSKMLKGYIPTLVPCKIDLPELQGPSPIDISIEKCKAAARLVDPDTPIITEDTSLCFTALNELPGAYIKWFLEGVGHEGLNNMLSAYSDKSATAMCIFTFKRGDMEPVTFVGRCPGQIVPAQGPPDFGWDAIFQPSEQLRSDDQKITFAQMDKNEKNTMSHRSKALALMKEWFNQHPEYLLGDVLPNDHEDDPEWFINDNDDDNITTTATTTPDTNSI